MRIKEIDNLVYIVLNLILYQGMKLNSIILKKWTWTCEWDIYTFDRKRWWPWRCV